MKTKLNMWGNSLAPLKLGVVCQVNGRVLVGKRKSSAAHSTASAGADRYVVLSKNSASVPHLRLLCVISIVLRCVSSGCNSDNVPIARFFISLLFLHRTRVYPALLVWLAQAASGGVDVFSYDALSWYFRLPTKTLPLT